MKIMLVNDDGYRALGIVTLGRALQARGHEVIVCAPDRERSAAGHSFTITEPLRAREFTENGLKGWAIDGTPADCARLGLYMLNNDVDLTISGINRGANLGGACVYSGTISGAMEAAMCGCQAMATSLYVKGPNDFESAAKVTISTLEWVMEHPLAMGDIYSLNVPDIPYESIKGVRGATLAPKFLGESKYEKRRAPYNFDYYWLVDGVNVPMEDPESDVLLCEAGWATMSRLTWNMMAPEPPAPLDIAL